ncbi:MAG: DNA polymerase [Pelagibacterales bacterium]|nr:DNA polymerase [Pelagibacterales bacterium]
MIKKPINQNDSYKLELLNSIGYDYVFDNNPINHLKDKTIQSNTSKKDKTKKLENLKNEINSIEDCKLKKNSQQIVFADGNINSPLMIIGEAPGKKENQSGKAFNDVDGELLKKMLLAINIKKNNVYLTYVVNYRPPDDRKPNTDEIKRYSIFLQKHVSIINPKIIILMGSTAMEALTGLNSKISTERGKWREVIIKNTNYNVMITFNPSYLLRFPENKKYSWEDLKKIKQKIMDLNLSI